MGSLQNDAWTRQGCVISLLILISLPRGVPTGTLRDCAWQNEQIRQCTIRAISDLRRPLAALRMQPTLWTVRLWAFGPVTIRVTGGQRPPSLPVDSRPQSTDSIRREAG